ncbi:hypothetical protein [Streptomyces griseofuscus]|uniref:hypothetical protein n=1 Tax=Streptomyces griseofuscus TaxID=146922 RepID=UPI003CC5E5E5
MRSNGVGPEGSLPNDGIGSAGRFTCEGREPWYSNPSPPPNGVFGDWKCGPPVGRGAAGVYEVAVLVRKFHRHSSQKGAPPSRGVRHCGHSSASPVAAGGRAPCRPAPGGGKP